MLIRQVNKKIGPEVVAKHVLLVQSGIILNAENGQKMAALS